MPGVGALAACPERQGEGAEEGQAAEGGGWTGERVAVCLILCPTLRC
jgi:hypothetical protein